ncbi:MAG TPA: glycosyltransferase family 1 protein, partial [Acidobacteria bacterium]|nr:glycosyltransferase family 1 protein [Acidobacteriota bacterium]
PAPVRALFLALERLAARWTTHVITVSRADLERGARLGLFERDRATVIRSGIRLGRFAAASGGEALRRELGIPAGAVLISQIGNFKPQKAPLDFVRMAARVAAATESFFLMTGDGPLRAAAEAAVGEAGLGSRFRFTGWRGDIPAILDATDVAVLASRHEGLPRAVVEALAAGVPVVATAVDGTPEAVRDGVDGFLVPPGEPAVLAERVLRLVRDRELRRRMAAAPRDLGEFDIDTMVRRQEDLYRWLMSRTRT